MAYTKQPRSLPVIDKPNKAESFSVQQIKIGNPEEDEINDSLFSIYYSLSNLYTKLQRLNSVIIQQKEKGRRK